MKGLGKRAIVGEEKNSIEEDLKKVLLRHYLAHYSKCGFSDFLASVPAKCLADDHEYFNAVGSYPYHWPILQIIRSVADYFYYLFSTSHPEGKCTRSWSYKVAGTYTTR